MTYNASNITKAATTAIAAITGACNAPFDPTLPSLFAVCRLGRIDDVTIKGATVTFEDTLERTVGLTVVATTATTGCLLDGCKLGASTPTEFVGMNEGSSVGTMLGESEGIPVGNREGC